MIDFSNCKVDPYKTFGGANGSKLGIIYQDKPYMLKIESKPRHKDFYSNGVLSEHIGCQIMRSLQIPAQQTILGAYKKNGKFYSAVACEDLTQGGYTLRQFTDIQNSCIEASSSVDGKNQIFPMLKAIEEQVLIDPVKVKEFYWDQFIGDAFIGNFDRHPGNWGFLLNEQTRQSKICPVFDCGSALYPQAMEEDKKMILSSKAEIEKRIYVFPQSAMRIDDQKINYFDYISSFGNKDCTDALLRIAPRIDMDKVNTIIDNIDNLSDLQKTFYKTMLLKRKEKIIDFSLQKFYRQEENRYKTKERIAELIVEGVHSNKPLYMVEREIHSKMVGLKSEKDRLLEEGIKLAAQKDKQVNTIQKSRKPQR